MNVFQRGLQFLNEQHVTRTTTERQERGNRATKNQLISVTISTEMVKHAQVTYKSVKPHYCIIFFLSLLQQTDKETSKTDFQL